MSLILADWFIVTVTLLVTFITLFYFYAKHTYSYWQRKGVQSHAGVSYFFGHFAKSFTREEFIADVVTKIYRATNEPFIGIYSFYCPVLLLRDPELIRSILIKDFSHFTDRGIYCNESFDPLSGHLFALPGQRWRNLRAKLRPAFTLGKLKAMFTTITDCGSTLQNYLNTCSDSNELLGVSDIASCYTTNVIASVAFGIDVDAISDPNTEMRVCGRKIFEPTIKNAIRSFGTFIAPKFMSLMRMRVADERLETFLRSIVTQNLELREKNHIVRKDIFQLMVQLRNNGEIHSQDDEWTIKSDEQQKMFTIDEIAAQAFAFFAAGFETSSSTLTFCLYELAKNFDIQQRVHDEIDRVLQKHNGVLSYDSVSEMKFLEACVNETLRLYPILPILNRCCVKEYRLPGTDLVIDKGTQIFIPVLSLQRDEQYYEEPNKFDPERFSDEQLEGTNQLNRPYLPFGDGPRNCVGLRLGKLQTKIGLVMMLQKFNFNLKNEFENGDVKFHPNIFLLSAREPIQLRVSKR